MVRLKREIEGLKWDDQKVEPAFLCRADLRLSLDEPFLARVRDFEWDEGGRVLLVSPPISLVESMLELASHVTIVEHDEERGKELIEKILPTVDVRCLTLHQKRYADIAFERSSFDLIVSFDDLNYYGSPGNAVWKYGRELKVNGALLARVILIPLEEDEEDHGWAFSQRRFESEASGGIRIEGIERISVAGLRALQALDSLPTPLRWVIRKSMNAAKRVDKSLSTEAREANTAAACLVGYKSLGFGKVFQLD